MICPWPERTTIEVRGKDRYKLLQGLLTNNVEILTTHPTLFSALLTPQGKFDADFLIHESDQTIFLLVENCLSEEIALKLNRYKLRYDVHIESTQKNVYHLCEKDIAIATPHLRFDDPRDARLGEVLILLDEKNTFNKNYATQLTSTHPYEKKRIELGVPEGTKDLTRGKSVILEFGFDEMHAIDWNKGCYLGQELMTRTKHLGQLRNYVFPITLHDEIYPPTTKLATNGRSLGKILSTHDNMALARLKLEFIRDALLEGQSLETDQGSVSVGLPAWISDPETIYKIANL